MNLHNHTYIFFFASMVQISSINVSVKNRTLVAKLWIKKHLFLVLKRGSPLVLKGATDFVSLRYAHFSLTLTTSLLHCTRFSNEKFLFGEVCLIMNLSHLFSPWNNSRSKKLLKIFSLFTYSHNRTHTSPRLEVDV